MLTPQSRGLLERYALASSALSRVSGERLAREAGQSVEFHDFRPYQQGDELRYVDWKVYGRTGRIYTRLYRAERTTRAHILLDTSPSMTLGHKARYARLLAQMLTYVAQGNAVTQVHLFNGQYSPLLRDRAQMPAAWAFVENAQVLQEGEITPMAALKRFALGTPLGGGAGLAIIISDLFDEAPLQTALAALKARGFDASFLQVMAQADLEPESGQLELVDLETGEKLLVSPDEVRAYHEAVQGFITRTRGAILGAGFRHALLRIAEEEAQTLERAAFAALIRAGMLVKR